jgi:hypothetical protein
MALTLKEGECGALVIDWEARTVTWHGLDGSGVPMTPEAAVALDRRHENDPDVAVQLLTVYEVDGGFQLTSDATAGEFVAGRCE